jgi:NAD(P)H-dependent FMN reductase
MKKVLAISGSTRTNSSNGELINCMIKLSDEIFHIEKFLSILDIPHFNPDNDYDNPPAQVVDFRKKIREVDAVLICTPEYAMGVPGTLKNAFDWLVSSCELSKKPTALITASSLGEKGHASLMETLKVIEARIPEKTQLIISFIKTKISNGSITDSKTEADIIQLLENLNQLILESENESIRNQQ